MQAYLKLDHIDKTFARGNVTTEVLKDINLTIDQGEYVSIIGHSGCGKSTLLNIVAGLTGATNGGVLLENREVNSPGPDRAVVFQNHSLLPWLTVYDNVRLAVTKVFGTAKSRAEQHDWIMANLDLVQMTHAADKRPGEISGGMRQRVMIAMALACRPALLIADEPTTALDVTIQAQILALIVDLQQRLGTGLILITHDLGVVAQTAQRVIVMYAGKKVEEATVEALFETPQHPYTRGLMASIPAVPSPDRSEDVRLIEIPGMVPSLTRLPPGCAFAPRCKLAVDRCRQEYPPLDEVKSNHWAACWRAGEMAKAS